MAADQVKGSSGAPSAGGTLPGGVGSPSIQDFRTKHGLVKLAYSLMKMGYVHRVDR
jgi:hypothetical protein